MATSGTTSFTLSINEVIEEAYERIGMRVNSGHGLRSARRSLDILFSEWGNETKGMLINFGEDDLEIWFVQFNDKGDTDHIRLMKLPRIINKSWETNAFKMTT